MRGLLARLLRRGSSPVPLAEIRAAFDRDAADEANFPTTIDPRILHVQLLLEQLATLDPLRTAVDVGSGKGRFSVHAQERFPDAQVICSDLSAGMLAHVPQPLHTCQATMTALPFRTESLDAAYAIESLEHAVEIEAAVAELCRIVRPGGLVFIIDKNRDHWGKLATPAWERWFGQRELEQLLRRHCRHVESRPLSYWADVAPDGLHLVWIGWR